VKAPKRTPGVSNPVDVKRAYIDRIADEDHALAGAHYVNQLEARARAHSFVAKLKAKLGIGR
jgi:hypothetical protein